MKKTLIALSALCIGCIGASAAPVSPEQALSRLESNRQGKLMARSLRPMKLVATLPELYLFSNGEGYALLPSDDCAPALLGYSDHGSADVGDNPSARWWLSEYARQINYARAHGMKLRAATASDRTPIPNIVQTQWNQESPYNALCPKLNGHPCATGCVATAMAQVMKVYNYPSVGIGTHSYHWAKGDTTLTFDYGGTTFRWNEMTDTYGKSSTQEQKDAVATLMYACGVSVDMIYGPESGAYSQSMGPALQNLFGYDQGGWMPYRDYYDLDTWQGMIYDNLAQGMPVLYTGVGSDGGHQFVCDGYNTDGYFHFNWGWGGLSDGYFLLTALQPSALGVGGGDGGFDYQQAASLGIQPPREGSQPKYILCCTNGLTTDDKQYKMGTKILFRGHYTNYSYFALPTGAVLGMQITDQATDSVQYATGRDVADMGSYSGIGGLTVDFPVLKEGTYLLKPALRINDEWEPVQTILTGNPSFLAVAKGDSIYLQDPDVARPGGVGLKMNSELMWGRPFSCSFTATNTGTREYMGNIIPQLLTPDGTEIVARGVKQPIDIPEGDSIPVTYTGTWTLNTTYSKTAPEPGPYKLVVADQQGVALGDTLDLQMVAAPATTKLEIHNLRLDTKDPSLERNNLQFTFTAECTEGYFSGNIEVLVFPSTGGEYLVSGQTGDVFIPAGESKQYTVSIDMSAYGKGTYIAESFSHGLKGNQVYFRLDDIPTGADSVTATPREHTIYNLQGIPVSNPIPGNIYIVDHRKVIYNG